MTAAEIASYVSLALAFVFWYLSSRQADSAKKTLDDIKTEILTWQSQLNKAAIDIISSRPEVIAKQTALEETKSLSAFDSKIAELVKHISSNPLPKEEGGEYQLAVLDKLLLHHKSLILGKQQIMAQVVAAQSGQQPPKPETKQTKGNE
jgi:hypothetical protein